MNISALVQEQQTYFRSGATLPPAQRRKALQALLAELDRREPQLLQALKQDLNKAPFEGYMTELGMIKEELHFHLRHLDGWCKPRRVPTPISQFPARSIRQPEPYGVTLVMAPWNYPLQLSLVPMIGALSAGNCVILKPSAYAPACSQALAELIAACLPRELVAVVEGGRAENQALLEQPFDFIFFTGSPAVGRHVMEMAARNLTPVVLELGGKSPVIVTADADLPLAARRIAFGKLLNAGQTCVAPDYVLVDRQVKDRLCSLLQEAVIGFLGETPLDHPDYPRIINEKHFHRLEGLLSGGRILWGGQQKDGRIAPTLMDEIAPGAAVMEEEIFGPILPILPYDTLEEAMGFVRSRPKPLALYLFTRDKQVQRQVLSTLPFGGGCVNDTIVHLTSPHLPFGGVGNSGMGSYHGRASFDTFSHYKSILIRGGHPDLPLRYHPYSEKKLGWLRKFLG